MSSLIWVPNWATTSVFPSDDTTREFLKQEERDQWIQLEADEGAYDKEIEIDLATIEPLIALPEAR
jgi:aconitate hydratase